MKLDRDAIIERCKEILLSPPALFFRDSIERRVAPFAMIVRDEEPIGEVGEAKPSRAYSFPTVTKAIDFSSFVEIVGLQRQMEDHQRLLLAHMERSSLEDVTPEIFNRRLTLTSFLYNRDALKPLPNPCGECPWRNDHAHQAHCDAVAHKVLETQNGHSPCHTSPRHQCEGARLFKAGPHPLIIPTVEEFVRRRARRELPVIAPTFLRLDEILIGEVKAVVGTF